MFSKITLPVRMDREPKTILGLEFFEEKIAHLMVVGWDGSVLTVILATQPEDDHPNQTRQIALSLIRQLLNVKTDEYFDLKAMKLKPITAAQFLDLVLEFGRKHPQLDNGDNPNHSHLFRMMMHKQYDLSSKLIKRNIGKFSELGLSTEDFPSNFDDHEPILMVSSSPLISHLVAIELRRRYQKWCGRKLKPIYVTSISLFDRLIDYADLFSPATLEKHKGEVIMINFELEKDYPLAVKLFDQLIMPELMKLAQECLVILISDNPYVLDHYKASEMTVIDMNNRKQKH